ncbi:hypothetical protein [Desulfosporosinus sp. Sb-LF]|uniref:tetratricopeptide repeat protein n=1 Tax=Desulfosporosinus sp. Sb-LF TaxID=2560027 RepID=UPI00107F4068|nr:hypothetical protein [Desulfosporosinus sp. Sb-LF]TGE33986.1 hypothetical protein E4K68_04050 [Desulfosporosinus sp. Sb-LF]
MKKKQQRVFATILAVLISVAMIGSAVVGYFVGGGVPPGTNSSTKTTSATEDYQAKKARVEAMAQQAKTDPGNVPLQSALGDGYYDAGMAALDVAPTDAQGNFKHAVEAYQNVLKTNKDFNVVVDMATAAFYSGDNELAEKTYKEALVLKPDSYNALGNYGIFLSQAKKDWAGALTQWQKAQSVAQTSDEKDRMKTLISEAENQLKANNAPNGISNPNPALKNGTSNSATP